MTSRPLRCRLRMIKQHWGTASTCSRTSTRCLQTPKRGARLPAREHRNAFSICGRGPDKCRQRLKMPLSSYRVNRQPWNSPYSNNRLAHASRLARACPRICTCAPCPSRSSSGRWPKAPLTRPLPTLSGTPKSQLLSESQVRLTR